MCIDIALLSAPRRRSVPVTDPPDSRDVSACHNFVGYNNNNNNNNNNTNNNVSILFISSSSSIIIIIMCISSL